MDFMPATDETLVWWHDKQRTAMAEADKASARWRTRSAALDVECEMMDAFNRRKTRQNDWVLADDFAGWGFWEREVQRFGAMIQTEATMRMLMARKR